uniref:Uncharacterized protein n=1 Tax=Corethron hystrix TaxID=216773 RepID=A0A7S1BSJ8_9STRA|mmetsp:Transcript_39465/g.92197  ORF Transcript_39465/g.92197 Transcript_39465/m.92197 type:complete len:138 (+) Transcript_39465:74-487(+)
MTEAVRTSHRRPLPSTCTALTHKEKPTTSFFIFQGPCCFWKNALPAMTETAGTFHRRPLPSTCTALASKEGRIRFKSALAQNYLASFFPLIEQLYVFNHKEAHAHMLNHNEKSHLFLLDPNAALLSRSQLTVALAHW